MPTPDAAGRRAALDRSVNRRIYLEVSLTRILRSMRQVSWPSVVKSAERARSSAGSSATRTTSAPRRFEPNLQTVRAMINGGIKRIRVCTRCLRSNKVVKAA